MIQSQETTLAHEGTGRAGRNESGSELTLPLRSRPRTRKLNCPTALVASSDERVLLKLAEMIAQCGLSTFLAFTVWESIRILHRQKICVVVCDDRLIDGKYKDILDKAVRLPFKTPLIVVSRTGDWPDYLKAISAGAFDYQAYPPIPGELPRSIGNALTFRTAGGFQDETREFFSPSIGGAL
jgi:DNA-binding NtrC family response regulator